MKKIALILTVSVLMFSCGGNEEKSEESKKNKEKAAQVEGEEKESKEIVANAETTINIDGMVCEHACVSSVKKNILAMEGVTGIEIDFEKERKVNSCKVSFDNNLVSEEDMINKINEINDGAYKVVDGEESNSDAEIKEESEDTDVSFFEYDSPSYSVNTSIGSSIFSFPSLADLFTFGF